ncbi:MAG: formylglycine-generating enzyme family protein [Candidatus Poribacteria bacterium]|nr:formylglycine-generating enzyme family protein [Candidatus Poribacteria bacterium]
MRSITIFLFIAIITGLGCEQTATVEITSQPSGATVFIDGEEVGVTPYIEKVQGEMSSRRLMVSKPGYKAGTAELKPGGGKLTQTFQLEKIDLSEMTLIPAGKFLMGTTDEEASLVVRQLGGEEVTENIQWFMAEKPQYEVDLPAFYIDKFELTNAAYKEFIDATGRPAPRHWENNTYPEGEDRFPVVYVSWKDANAYCQWAGKRLPTGAEWEKAARGTDARIWPWGDEFDITKCNVESWEGSGPKPVGSYPQGVSPYGVYDLGGNVWEWTSSWYEAYPGSTYTTPEFGKKFRVLRGGSWYHYDSLGPIGARCASRDRGTEYHVSYVAGFRCAIGEKELGGGGQ